MIDFGIVRPGTTLYVPFHTFDSNDPSASVTITGLATADIEIYKDGSATQRASDAGYSLLDTDGIDFDTVTGVHGFSIDLADNTTGGFYAAGSQYWVVVSSITVDAATINFVAATFRIGYPSAMLNTTIATLSTQTSFTLTSGPAEDDALNGMEVVIHDVASAVQMGRAVISDYTGATKTVTLAAGTTFTAAATDNVAVIGPSPLQPTTAGNKLGVASDGDISGDVDGNVVGSVASVTADVGVNEWNGVALSTMNPLPNAAAGAAGGLPTDSAGKTSFNDIAATAIVSAGAITTSAGAVSNVTTVATVTDVTNDLSKYAGPRGPGVYVNDASGVTGTTDYTHGTVTNPVDNIANALTIADSLSLDRIYLVNDSAVTLVDTRTDYEFVGIGEPGGNSVALGSQDISSSAFYNLSISGVQGGASRALYEDCYIGTATIHAMARRCGFTDAVTGVTFSNNDDNALHSCFSKVAGNGTPIFICSGANLGLSIRDFSGGVELKTLSATATVSIETDGQVVFNADCNTNAVVAMRGCLTITDNTGGMSALTQGAVVNRTNWNGGDYALDTDSNGRMRIVDGTGAGEINTNAGAIATVDTVTTVTSLGTDSVDAASLATDAVAEIVDGVWDETLTAHVTADSAAVAVKDTLADTNELQGDWADAGRLDAILDARASQASVDALNDLSAAQVNAEVVDALATDTYAEPGQGAPAATTTLAAKINYLYKSWRNKSEQTSTTWSLYDDAGSTVDQKVTVSDNGTTASKGEVATGP